MHISYDAAVRHIRDLAAQNVIDEIDIAFADDLEADAIIQRAALTTLDSFLARQNNLDQQFTDVTDAMGEVGYVDLPSILMLDNQGPDTVQGAVAIAIGMAMHVPVDGVEAEEYHGTALDLTAILLTRHGNQLDRPGSCSPRSVPLTAGDVRRSWFVNPDRPG